MGNSSDYAAPLLFPFLEPLMYRLFLTRTIIVTELVQSVSILVGLVSMMCSSRRFGRDRLRAFSGI